MSEETAGAAPSAVVESAPSLEIPRSGTAEYAQWRVSGELPEKKVEPKPAETAPADAGKEQATDDGGAEPPKQQEKRRKPDAEARIKQLTDDLKRVRQELDGIKQPKAAESAPAKSAPQNYQEWRKTFTASKWIEDYGKQNPQSSYEDATAAMADYLGDVRDQFRTSEQQRNKQAEELNSKISDARKRYGAEFDQVLSPTVNQILGNNSLSPAVKAMLNDSEMLPDVIFTLGSDADGLKSFMQMAPGKQLRYIAAVESGIQAELNKAPVERTETGQFKPPAKRGPESAPEPPLEIGNRGGITLNESERALQAIQKGDAKATRAWMQSENQKAFARRRGA
jgi:hypothetical protein